MTPTARTALLSTIFGPLSEIAAKEPNCLMIIGCQEMPRNVGPLKASDNSVSLSPPPPPPDGGLSNPISVVSIYRSHSATQFMLMCVIYADVIILLRPRCRQTARCTLLQSKAARSPALCTRASWRKGLRTSAQQSGQKCQHGCRQMMWTRRL